MRDPSQPARGRGLGDVVGPPAETSGAERPRADAALDEPTGPYEDWTLVELRRRAATLGIVGRSGMRKGDLIRALRSPSGRSGRSGSAS